MITYQPLTIIEKIHPVCEMAKEFVDKTRVSRNEDIIDQRNQIFNDMRRLTVKKVVLKIVKSNLVHF